MLRASSMEDSMKKRKLILISAIIAFLFALGLTLYPLIAEKYNAAHQSAIHADYANSMKAADNSEKEAALAAARAYNDNLRPGVTEAYSKEQLLKSAEDYAGLLNITDTGIMGYVSVPAISVELPIYHGTNDATLEKGVGHLLGSSLPVGGEGTHTVLTGHSGMASKRMFSDLADMETGDIFFLDVLDERLAYEVTEINTVLPYETELLEIQPDEDLCTLVTCTPYGVNTHRLLVRGTRTEYTEEQIVEAEQIEPDQASSTWTEQYQKGITTGLAVVAVIVIIAVIVGLLRGGHHGSRS